MSEWIPVDHKSPLPPIDLQPVRKPTQPTAKSFWELQAENEEETRQKRESERIWSLVRQAAESNGSAA